MRGRPELDEVNFWRPGGQAFRALAPGEPFFFKLKAPRQGIAGFGLFARYERLPLVSEYGEARFAHSDRPPPRGVMRIPNSRPT
jgi:putative restriction endonuclease